MIARILKRLAYAWEALRYGPDPYEIGRPALDAEGEPMRRCTSCGIPRGTLRHAGLCHARLCADPDARKAS